MKRSRLEIARAVLRLSGEPLVPVDQLCERARASSRALVRWITAGRAGVFLDGVHRPGTGWVSSGPALERFLAASFAASQRADAAERARLDAGGTT